jgi:hypothetical protein
MSRSTSPVSEAKITLTPAACVIGLVVSMIHCSAMMMRPSPTRMRPKRPILLFSRRRKSTTPEKMRKGESHDRSNEKMSTIRLVPTSAPSMTESAGAVAIRPWPTKDATINAVAVLLWSSAVTPSPAANAAKRLATLCRSTRRRSPP